MWGSRGPTDITWHTNEEPPRSLAVIMAAMVVKDAERGRVPSSPELSTGDQALRERYVRPNRNPGGARA